MTPPYFWLIVTIHLTMMAVFLGWAVVDAVRRADEGNKEPWWKLPLVLFVAFPYHWWIFPKYVMGWALSWCHILLP